MTERHEPVDGAAGPGDVAVLEDRQVTERLEVVKADAEGLVAHPLTTRCTPDFGPQMRWVQVLLMAASVLAGGVCCSSHWHRSGFCGHADCAGAQRYWHRVWRRPASTPGGSQRRHVLFSRAGRDLRRISTSSFPRTARTWQSCATLTPMSKRCNGRPARSAFTF